MGFYLLQMSHSDALNMPAIISWQGPFHVALNIEESTVMLFWPFFEYIYKGVFGKNKKFPKKPRAEKISTVTSAAFGGWLVVRDIVLQLFGQCKDPEFLMLFYLLDEVSAFNFYSYTVLFKGGSFESWLHSLVRASMTFIVFRRRNYDKATLCQISDILFHLSQNPDLGQRVQEYLQVFTEKKVEIFHSVLRR